MLPTVSLTILFSCDGEKPTPEVVAPEVVAPEVVVVPASVPTGRVYDFPSESRVSVLEPTLLKADPMNVLLLSGPVPDDMAVVGGWLEANPKVYSYLPPTLQADPAIQQKAVALGLPRGMRITTPTVARVAPDAGAREALYPSDTPNGYLAEGRQPQALDGQTLAILEEREVGGQRWYRVVSEKASTPEADRRAFEDVSNVGGVAFEDFSFAQDPGWVPASVTAPGVAVPRCESRLLVFQSVSNGDLGIYTDFDGIGFSSFGDAEYVLLEAAEKGRLAAGDRVRVVWCDEQITWVPPALSAAGENTPR